MKSRNTVTPWTRTGDRLTYGLVQVCYGGEQRLVDTGFLQKSLAQCTVFIIGWNATYDSKIRVLLATIGTLYYAYSGTSLHYSAPEHG